MNRLEDMLHFPAVVNAGATLNILITVAATWWVAPRWPLLPVVWIAAVLALNLAPVVLLRLLDKRPNYPTLAAMDFFRDQHRFSNWVYLAASANMTFWILLSWTLALIAHRSGVLIGLECLAAVATFSPVLARAAFSRSEQA